MKRYIKSAFTGSYSNREDYLNSLSSYQPETFVKLPITEVADVRDILIQLGIPKSQVSVIQDYWNLNPNFMNADDNMLTLSYEVYLRPWSSSDIQDELTKLGFSKVTYDRYTFIFFKGWADEGNKYIKQFWSKYGRFWEGSKYHTI